MSKLILNNGKPFTSEEIAWKYIDSKLKGKCDTIEMDGGYAIIENALEKPKPVKYIVCRIAPRNNENEDEVIDLAIQGRQLQVRRGTDVILPEHFVKMAEQAIIERFELRGSVLVKTGETTTCPITRLKEATEKEFKAQIEKGNATRDEEIRRINATSKS